MNQVPRERVGRVSTVMAQGQALRRDDHVLSPVGDISSVTSHFLLLASL